MTAFCITGSVNVEPRHGKSLRGDYRAARTVRSWSYSCCIFSLIECILLPSKTPSAMDITKIRSPPPPPAANLVPRAFPLKNGWGGKSPGDEVVLLRYYFRSRKSTETGVSLTHVWFGYQKWSKSPPFMEPCYRWETWRKTFNSYWPPRI